MTKLEHRDDGTFMPTHGYFGTGTYSSWQAINDAKRVMLENGWTEE